MEITNPLGGVYETMPARLYTDPAVFADEHAQIFRRCWHLAGHLTDLSGPGAYFTVDIVGASILVICGQDGEVRAFYNVCVHRGHELVTGAGCVKRLTCPYHAWTYDTTGQLRAAPNGAGFPGFDPAAYRLKDVRIEIFHGLILVNLDPEAAQFWPGAEEATAEIADYAPNLGRYVHAARTERRAAANWKVVAENFNECYHCAIVHRTLTSGVIDPDQYRTRDQIWGIRHESPARPDAVKSYGYVADPDARTDRFLTWWFWPLFAIQVYPGGIVNTYRWRPEAVDRTTIEVDWWLPNKVPNAVERAIIDQHRTTTFAEDGPIVDAVQRGLASGGFDRGPLVVENACGSQSEHPILAFQRQYLCAMGLPETAGVSAA